MKTVYSKPPDNPVYVMEEEWKYLVLLDACRFDYFKEYNSLPGRLEKRNSPTSNTVTWLKSNFKDYYEDIVYVSSNPHISNQEVGGFKGTDHFHSVENVWDYGWCDELGTVPPEEVTKAALKAKEKYPDKRLIIHYIQPHDPWIGETKILKDDEEFIWDKIKWGPITKEKIRKAYQDNLKLVLKEINRLIPKLEGKIIATSDHGEALGEKYLFSHTDHLYIKELVEIPWMEINK